MIKDVRAGVGFPLLPEKPKHLKILSIPQAFPSFVRS